jgi:hypothetical protein
MKLKTIITLIKDPRKNSKLKEKRLNKKILYMTN